MQVSYSRPTLGPTWPPILWFPKVLSPRVKRLRGELSHKTLYSAEVKNEWRQLVVGLLSRRLQFYLRAVLFGFVVDKVVMGKVLLAVFHFLPVIVFPPMLHTH